jgi:hypothetical protein
MRYSIRPVLVALLVCFACSRPAAALDFFMDLSRVTANGVTFNAVEVFLEANSSEFDDFVDEYVLISPNSDLTISTTEFFNGFDGLGYANFTGMTNAIYGTWTLEDRVFGLLFNTRTFQVSPNGLTPADMPASAVLSPTNGTLVHAQPVTMTWQGPSSFDDVLVVLTHPQNSYPDGVTNFPANVTQWTPSFELLAGTNEIYLNYSKAIPSNQEVTIGSPGGPWSSGLYLHSVAFSEFTLAGGLVITGPERLAGGQLRWSYQTSLGTNYVLQVATSPSPVSWTSFQTNAGNGSIQTFTVTPTPVPRFYRIELR